MPKKTLHIVRKREESLLINHAKSYVISFQPLDEHELITDIQFPGDVYIVLLDNHSIKMTLMFENLDSFDIVSDTRILHVNVE